MLSDIIFTDYTNVGQKFPLIFIPLMTTLFLMLCKRSKRPGLLMFEENVFSVM